MKRILNRHNVYLFQTNINSIQRLHLCMKHSEGQQIWNLSRSVKLSLSGYRRFKCHKCCCVWRLGVRDDRFQYFLMSKVKDFNFSFCVWPHLMWTTMIRLLSDVFKFPFCWILKYIESKWWSCQARTTAGKKLWKPNDLIIWMPFGKMEQKSTSRWNLWRNNTTQFLWICAVT